MILHLKNGNYENGAYGTVIFDIENKKAIKVFKRREPYREQKIKETFESEVLAYNIAIKNDDLKKYIPNFYGKCEEIEKIHSEDGEDISNQYYLNCAYTMEYIDDKFMKNNCYLVDQKNKEEIFKLFKDSEIMYLIDSSVSINHGGQIVCVIDFAINDNSYEF